MYFSKNKKSPKKAIRVMIYSGYDPKTGHSKSTYLGSLDPETLEPNKSINGKKRQTLGLMEAIEQREDAYELKQKLDDFRAAELLKKQQEKDASLESIAFSAMHDLIEGINRGVKLQQPDFIWENLDNLRSALRKHKYPKPKKAKPEEGGKPKAKKPRKSKKADNPEEQVASS